MAITNHTSEARTNICLPLELYFSSALKDGLMRYELDARDTTQTTPTQWLTVYYREPLGGSQAEGWRWAHLCSQDWEHYRTPTGRHDDIALVRRVTLMLADKCRSLSQDVNILQAKH